MKLGLIKRSPELGQFKAPSSFIQPFPDAQALSQGAIAEQNKTYLILGGVAIVGVGAGILLWKKMNSRT